MTYRVSTYDPGETLEDEWGWTAYRSGLSRWQLRDAIRELRGMGYVDDFSILVSREQWP